MIVAGALSVAACAPLPNWLTPTAQHRSPHEVGESPASANGPASVMPRRSTSEEGIRVVDLAFDTVRIDFPAAGVRHSRKLWNHVDELRLDPEMAARLARNGLRVGAGSPGAWPAISAILEATDAVVRRDQFVAQRGLPLVVHSGSVSDAESIFGYGADDRLVGKTFTAGDKLINVDYVFRPEMGGSTEVHLSFEICHDRGAMTWEQRDGVVQQVPDYERHVFAGLSPSLTLNPDEFLVIGLSDQVTNEYLVGGRFFTHVDAGKRYETVLCLTPRAYQTSAPTR